MTQEAMMSANELPLRAVAQLKSDLAKCQIELKAVKDDLKRASDSLVKCRSELQKALQDLEAVRSKPKPMTASESELATLRAKVDLLERELNAK